jgi:hypothetical protein
MFVTASGEARRLAVIEAADLLVDGQPVEPHRRRRLSMHRTSLADIDS